MRKSAPIAWSPRLSPARNASRTLPPLVRAYFEQGRQVVAASAPPAELHALRLATKRLRYTLELFRPCYGRGMETCLSSLQGLQQILGKVNDCVAAGRLIEGLAPESAARTRMLQFVDRRAAATAAALRKEWRERFDAPGKEQWWLRYLARNARAVKKSL
jgi:CHAD domain-containing protein